MSTHDSEHPTPDSLDVIFGHIAAEIAEQTQIHGVNAIGSPTMNGHQRMTILTEEVGEVAHELLEDNDLGFLRDELVQVAACAVAWLQAITCHCGDHTLRGAWLRVAHGDTIDYHGRTRCQKDDR